LDTAWRARMAEAITVGIEAWRKGEATRKAAP
jgi:hypothetical protein